MSTNPWDFINAVTFNKKDLISESDNSELEEKGYSPFIVNRGLSYFLDTVMYANEINQFYGLDHKLQFDYLLNSIRPKKRFSKWSKKNNSVDLDFLIDYYQVNSRRAEEILRILSKDQLKQLKKERDTGGIK